MRLPTMALALSMLCLASCAKPGQVRAVATTPDPAPLAQCPTSFPIAPELPPLAPFALPDGRMAVLLETVLERDKRTARYVVAGFGAWGECRSSVTYAQDWSAQMRAGSAVKP